MYYNIGTKHPLVVYHNLHHFLEALASDRKYCYQVPGIRQARTSPQDAAKKSVCSPCEARYVAPDAKAFFVIL